MKRGHVSAYKDKKIFSRTAKKVHPKNMLQLPMVRRGGYKI